jgi:hypothetical protein
VGQADVLEAGVVEARFRGPCSQNVVGPVFREWIVLCTPEQLIRVEEVSNCDTSVLRLRTHGRHTASCLVVVLVVTVVVKVLRA